MPAETVTELENPPLSAREGRVAHILVADDSEANRDLLCAMLAPHGYRVSCAQDGLQALQILESEPPDLALLDVVMPGCTGLEVCRAIKAKPERRLIPVVLITGRGSREDRIQGIDCGADDFLNKPVSREELLARVRSLLRLKSFTDELEHAETVLFSLAMSIEAKDPSTEGHCERLAQYAVELGRRLGLGEEEIVALRRAGIVHDIGKVAVSEQILLKPGPLTTEEFKIMQRHPVIGERICAPLKSFRLVLPIIRHHHEKQDGSGYPDGLKGEQIPLTARVLQTADVFDALTTDRPYRKAMSTEKAFEMMHREVALGWWDRRLVHEFESMVKGAPAIAGGENN